MSLKVLWALMRWGAISNLLLLLLGDFSEHSFFWLQTIQEMRNVTFSCFKCEFTEHCVLWLQMIGLAPSST